MIKPKVATNNLEDISDKIAEGISKGISKGISEGISEGLSWVLIAIALAGVAITREIESAPQIFPQTNSTFQSYTIYTSYFIDDSPSGSYDFTLERDGSQSVPIPSPCDGTVANVWYQGTASGANGNGGGQIVEIACGEYVWLFAHLEINPPVNAGEAIAKGESIGIQGLTGRTTGHHIHLQIHRNNNGQRSDRITDRNLTRPMVEHYIQWLRIGGDQQVDTKSGEEPKNKYERAIAETLRHEGGCQNSKADKGNYFQGERGYTCMGITPATAWEYRDWIGAEGFRREPVEFSKWAHDRNPENFKQATAEIILDYGFRAGCDKLESPAYEICTDIAFNSGVGRAQEYLTEIEWDENQKNQGAIAHELNERHRADYQKWGGVHLPGWLNRADEREKFIEQ